LTAPYFTEEPPAVEPRSRLHSTNTLGHRQGASRPITLSHAQNKGNVANSTRGTGT
jgi:hypothetical protein